MCVALKMTEKLEEPAGGERVHRRLQKGNYCFQITENVWIEQQESISLILLPCTLVAADAAVTQVGVCPQSDSLHRRRKRVKK